MDKTTFNTLLPDVRTAARITGREWADVIDAEDAEQEIWVRLLDAGQKVIDDLVNMDKPARVSVLVEIGHQIGQKYRDDYELFSGNYVYSVEQVRKMLKNDALAGVEDESGTPLWELPETEIKRLQRTDSMTVTERIDLFLGMRQLAKRNAAYADYIKCRYLDGDWSHIHREQMSRAIEALTKEMNRIHIARKAEYTEGPGTRKVMSNAEAMKLTRNEYNR